MRTRRQYIDPTLEPTNHTRRPWSDITRESQSHAASWRNAEADRAMSVAAGIAGHNACKRTELVFQSLRPGPNRRQSAQGVLRSVIESRWELETEWVTEI